LIVANNVALSDAYTVGNRWVTLSAMSIQLFVFNNAAAITLFKRVPGGGQDWDEMPEQVITPGSVTVTNCVGFKARNAVPGSVARYLHCHP